MADIVASRKNRGHVMLFEAKQLSIRPKVPHSFGEGFYEANRFYHSAWEWVTTKVQEAAYKGQNLTYFCNSCDTHIKFWQLLNKVDAIENERMRQEQFAHLPKAGGLKRPVPNTKRVFIKRNGRQEEYPALRFLGAPGQDWKDFEVKVVLQHVMEWQTRGKTGEETKPGTSAFPARFNAPALLQRRLTTIARANASHTRASDDALENILMEFEKLSF